MANMIDDALQYLSETMLDPSVAGVVIRYQAVNGDELTLNALPVGQGKDREYAVGIGSKPSESVYELLPPEKGYCGFLVRVSEFKNEYGIPIMPNRGDRITLTRNGITEVYDIAAPKGFLPWRDEETLPHRVHYRIHTKFKAKECF
jgi:hypothetical protein